MGRLVGIIGSPAGGESDVSGAAIERDVSLSGLVVFRLGGPVS